MPERIGIDISSALTQGGGIGRYTRELVRALTLIPHPYSLQLFSARAPAGKLPDLAIAEQPNIRFRKAPLDQRWLYRLWYRLRLPLPIQWLTGRLSLFHSPDFVLPPVGGDIPCLLTVHDLSFVHYPEAFPTSLLSFLNRVVPESVARADHVLADSIATKEDLCQLWQVPPAKITVMYSGVSQAFQPVRSEEVNENLRRKYRLGAAPYVLSVGTLQPRKNFQMLVGAFRTVADSRPHDLVIAGARGWLYDELMAEVESLNLGDRVRFAGFVADSDLPALYSGAALFVFPSLYEGFGLPLLEAMACEVPVLSSNASSLPEVAGDAAVLLPADDLDAWSQAMIHLLDDDDERHRLIAAGRENARQFGWDRAAEQLLGIYQRMLS